MKMSICTIVLYSVKEGSNKWIINHYLMAHYCQNKKNYHKHIGRKYEKAQTIYLGPGSALSHFIVYYQNIHYHELQIGSGVYGSHTLYSILWGPQCICGQGTVDRYWLTIRSKGDNFGLLVQRYILGAGGACVYVLVISHLIFNHNFCT